MRVLKVLNLDDDTNESGQRVTGFSMNKQHVKRHLRA
jgi:hypothetical protein